MQRRLQANHSPSRVILIMNVVAVADSISFYVFLISVWIFLFVFFFFSSLDFDFHKLSLFRFLFVRMCVGVLISGHDLVLPCMKCCVCWFPERSSDWRICNFLNIYSKNRFFFFFFVGFFFFGVGRRCWVGAMDMLLFFNAMNLIDGGLCGGINFTKFPTLSCGWTMLLTWC